MTFNVITLVIDLADGTKTPLARGSAMLAPSVQLTDIPDQFIAAAAPVQVPFGTGSPPSFPQAAGLAATDNTGPLPSGWGWGISFPGVPGSPAPFSFFLPAGPCAFTAANASPCVFTWTPAPAFTAAALVPLPNGTGVQLSGGPLPAGFTAGTTYYAVGSSGSTFQLASAPGGAPLASTGAGSGTFTVTQYRLSALTPVSSVTAMQAYMPLPSGAPAAGMIPAWAGTGEASAWTYPASLALPPSTGIAATDGAAIQGVLSAVQALGGGKIGAPPGASYMIAAPLRVASNTWLDMTGATVTLAANSNCNALQNWAVQANRRVLDAVTASGSPVLTSASAAFTGADTGSSLRVYYPDGTYLDTTVTYASATTVTMAASAAASGSGLLAVIGAGRDSNVRVTGGTWVRQSPNNPASSAAHQLRFRHVDRLEVGPINGTTADGRYLVSLGDCTRFTVHDILPSSTCSDTVHVNGPASAGVISRVINSSPGDDLVAFTCGELATYADVMGNITDVAVDNVIVPSPPATSPVVVKILAGKSPAGAGYLLDRITVRTVRSAIPNDYPVNICDDPSSGAYTVGGTWGKIVVSDIANISPSSTYPAVNVIGAAITDLEANGLYTANPASNLLVVQSPGGGHPASVVSWLKTDAPRGRITVNSGSSIRSWYSPSSAETPMTQPAVIYGDGTSVQATAPDAAALDVTGAVSLEMWLVPSSVQAGFWTPAGKSGQYWLEGDSGGLLKLAMSVQSAGTAYQAMIPAALQAGRMSYIAGTFVPSASVSTYVNGALAASNTTGIPAVIDTSTHPVYLLNRQGFSRYFAGQAADIRIWSGALTAADIALHAADPGNLYAASATLLARWKCDEGAGTTLNDSSGGGNTATLSSASWNAPYTPYLAQPQLSAGASHTVDDVITALQKIGLFRQ